jgi:diguanylate cyclase (GGDEF)-like protein
MLSRLQLSPAARLAVGLASLTVCLFLMLDFALGIVPDRGDTERRVRTSVAEMLAAQAALQLPSNDRGLLLRSLSQSASQHPEIRSLAVRSRSGQMIVQIGNHLQNWKAPADGRSTLTDAQVPIYSGNDLWGNVEITFTPVYPEHLIGWLLEPLVLAMAGLSLLGALFYYLYLRRALQYLDPSSAVPERVRAAFDTLTEGLLVLDTNGRVVLANQVFRRLIPKDAGSINGKHASDLKWLTETLGPDRINHPWSRALTENTSVEEEAFSIDVAGFEERRRYVLKANPITDGTGAKRGCLVTFDDVTRLHEINTMLRGTLDELKLSRAQVEEKNEELQRLASRDPLTGCLNRRSFFDQLERMQSVAIDQDEMLSFIMCDVDHFKSFNDRFGHALGDQVLQLLGNLLTRGIRRDDLLCRLGGEEFCIALRGLSVEGVVERADQLRQMIEREAGTTLGIVQDLRVTASFGVACMLAGSLDTTQLLELADQALYEAKRNGRNRVIAWPFARQDAEAATAVA